MDDESKEKKDRKVVINSARITATLWLLCFCIFTLSVCVVLISVASNCYIVRSRRLAINKISHAHDLRSN